MKKVITNNLKSIIAGSVIATSLIGLNACNESHEAKDLGSGDDVRDAVDEAKGDVEEVSKEVEGKCGEGKCGEGKCGEGKCGEGKCGEGKCGEESSDEATDEAAEEGKTGEGKCGEGTCGSK